MSVHEIRDRSFSLPAFTQGQKKASSPAARAEEQTPSEDGKAGTPVITRREKQYFESLFPQSADEIRPYQVYTQKGSKIVAASGTLIDRKG